MTTTTTPDSGAHRSGTESVPAPEGSKHRYLGRSMKRVEDPRLLVGRGEDRLLGV